jgi:hypothetical protein
MAYYIYRNSIGITFQLNMNIDLTDYQTVKILVRKPSLAKQEWTASIYGSAVNGQIEYNTVDGDLDEAGTYIIQSYAEMTDGSIYKGRAINVKIYAEFEGI